VTRFLPNVALATAVIGCALASSTYANASTYVFSYSFGSYGPGEVTGSFTGTGPVTDVTNISNISVKFDGTPLLGPLYAYGYNMPGISGCYAPNTCFTPGTEVASSIAANNNFLFINSSSSANGVFPGYSNYFYIIPWPNGAGNPEAVQFYSSPNFVPANQYNGDFIAANWSLTETPLPSAWTMLIAGFVCLGYFACRASKKSLAVPLAA
jgi:hypothetical protein